MSKKTKRRGYKFEPMMKRVRHKGGFNVGWFYCTVYRANVDLIWPVDQQKVVEYVKERYGVDHPTTDSFGAKCIELHKGEEQVNIICLREWDCTDPRDIAMLAHEVFHCAEHILSKRGISLHSGVTTEPYAYLIESIMRRCLHLLAE